MNRLLKKLWILILIATLIGTVGASTGMGSPRTPANLTIDPNLPVHPLLQFGAQVEPNKKVTIVVQKTGPEVASNAISKAAGASIKEEFPLINGLVLEVPQRVALVLGKQKGVKYITPDAPVRHTSIGTSLMKTTFPATITATNLWNGNPVTATGQGITVAVLDSGVNGLHPDLQNGIIAVSGNAKSTKNNDPNGHGTHVIGIIRGRDALGRYIGVAPESSVVSLKISDDFGASKEIDLIRGLQWVYSNRTKYNIRVVNLSVSGSVPTSYLTSPISAAAEQLWLSGIVVVVASGNRGPGQALYPPANDPWLLSVGALDENGTASKSDDLIATFSTRGVTQDGHYRPDVVAPGRKIVSTLSTPDSTLAKTFPDRITDVNYLRLSVTSMAAPVVSGMVALILERYPNLTPNQVKWLVINTAEPYSGMPDAAGSVNTANALERAALGNVGSANQGLQTSTLVDGITGTTQWAQSYWEQSYWEQSYWEQSYWEASTGYDAEATYDLVVED